MPVNSDCSVTKNYFQCKSYCMHNILIRDFFCDLEQPWNKFDEKICIESWASVLTAIITEMDSKFFPGSSVNDLSVVI